MSSPWSFSIGWPEGAESPVDVRGNFRSVVGSRVRRSLNVIKDWAAATTPFTHIADAYHVVQDSADGFEWSITNTDPHFWWVEIDTQPHNIPGAWGRPSPFGESGRFQGYFHPGTHGHHMFEHAWEQGVPLIEQTVSEGVAAFLARWGAYAE